MNAELRLIKYSCKGGEIERIIQRNCEDIDEIRNYVRIIIKDIRNRGDRAVAEYIKQHDKIELSPADFRISPSHVQAAYDRLSPELKVSLNKRGRNAKMLHRQQGFKETIIEQDGIVVGEIATPIESTGIYVPGGTAPLPTVMQILAVPASIAGVGRIVAFIPPNAITDEILAAAYLSGVHEVYQVGGVAAIAVMAYGTQSINPVLQIVGPGNVYVTAAKLEVFGKVKIEMPAGPSEVVIIAEPTSNAKWIALDVIARAEHDPAAAAVVVTWSELFARHIKAEVGDIANKFPRSDIICKALSKNSGIIITNNLEEAIAFTNDYGPEHLQIMTSKPSDVLPHIRNAGSIFLGHNCPVAVGDYLGISNHVLPTSGCAKMFSPVSVRDFQKVMQYQMISNKSLDLAYEEIIKPLVIAEKLNGHQASLEARLTRGNDVGALSHGTHNNSSVLPSWQEGKNMRKFKIGLYFDLYSLDHEDWYKEHQRNIELSPEFYDVMLEIPGSIRDFKPEDITFLRNLIGSIPLTVHAPTLNLSLCCLNRGVAAVSVAEHIYALDVCNLLGAKTITLHGGEAPYYAGLNNLTWVEVFNNNVQHILLAANNLNIDVCIENLKAKNVFPKSVDELDQIFHKNLDLKLAFDLRHFCAVGVDPFFAFERYSNKIASIHYRIDNGLDDDELKRFARMLYSTQFAGQVIIEGDSLNHARKDEREMLVSGYQKFKHILERRGGEECG